MHGADTSQNARQLILPDVSQPLCDGVLNHFVHTKETGHIADRKKLNCFLNILSENQTEMILLWMFYVTMGVCCGRGVSLFTRVCSRASSASTQNSLTEPDRSGSLQTFPEKQKVTQRPDQVQWNPSKGSKVFAQTRGRGAVWMTSHLLNDNVFAMIVQPDRHFRSKTKFPEKNREKI